MIRNLKALGLALLAVFAMSAMVAAAAQANPGTLTAEGQTVTLTGEQVGKHVFTLTDHPVAGGFAKVECNKAHFDGKENLTDGATTFTITPTYSECTAFGQPATINHTECHYLLHTGTTVPAGTGWHVNTTLVCPAGQEIHVTTATCEVRVPPQALNHTSEVTNSGGVGTAMDLLLHTNITGITYTVTKDNIGCPLTPVLPLPKTYHQGDYVGTTTVKAHKSVGGGLVGITLHHGLIP